MLLDSFRRWSCLSFVIFSVYSSCLCQSLATWNTMREGGLQQKLKQLTKNNAMIILDGDNIRGKTRFKLSKEGENVKRVQTARPSDPSARSSVTLSHTHWKVFKRELTRHLWVRSHLSLVAKTLRSFPRCMNCDDSSTDIAIRKLVNITNENLSTKFIFWSHSRNDSNSPFDFHNNMNGNIEINADLFLTTWCICYRAVPQCGRLGDEEWHVRQSHSDVRSRHPAQRLLSVGIRCVWVSH